MVGFGPERTTRQRFREERRVRLSIVCNDLRDHTSSASRLAPNAHIFRVAAKLFDILVRPEKGSLLIEKSGVQIRGRGACDFGAGEKTEGVHAVVGVYEDYVI